MKRLILFYFLVSSCSSQMLLDGSGVDGGASFGQPAAVIVGPHLYGHPYSPISLYRAALCDGDSECAVSATGITAIEYADRVDLVPQGYGDYSVQLVIDGATEETVVHSSPVSLGPERILVLGDSLVYSSDMGSQLAATYPYSEVTIYGVSGATWEWYSTNLDSPLLDSSAQFTPPEADLVIWQLATNDFKWKYTEDLDEAALWMRAVVNAWPGPQHGIATMQPGNAVWGSQYELDRWRTTQRAANQMLFAHISGGLLPDNASLIPIHVSLDPYDGYSTALYHPAQTGYDQIESVWEFWIDYHAEPQTTWSPYYETCLADGDAEQSGVAAWLGSGAASPSKVAHGTGQALRLSWVSGSNGSVYQTALVPGATYWVTGEARGDGALHPPRIRVGDTYWTGDQSTDWQEIDFEAAATTTLFLVYVVANASGWAEYDNLQVRRAR